MRIDALAALCAGLLLLAAPRPVCARPDDKPAKPVEKPVIAPDYVLGADDVIEIKVRNHSDLDTTLTILPDGKITMAEVGELKAAGKTPSALAREIQTALEATLNNCAVTVSVKEIHSRRARVIGAVRSPQAYDLKPGWRVIDLIAVAGGLTTKPTLVNGKVIRGGQVVPLNMAEAMAHPDGNGNVRLEPDDLVLLDQLDPVRNQVHVMGQVTKPGAYDLDDATSLLGLISQAGGTTTRAALSKAFVLRGTTQLPLNLRSLVADGKADDTVARFKLQPGDALFIPEIEARYAVMGQVGHAGYYPLPEQGAVDILEALNLAGGQTPGADLAKAGILRRVDGKATAIPINIDAMLKKADLKKDLALQADDILYIPAKGQRTFGLNDLLSPISALGLLGLRF